MSPVANEHVSAYFNLFFQLRQMSDGTRAIYTRAFGRLTQALGDKPADQYTPIDGQLFARSLADSTVRGKPVSPTTVNIYTRAVKAFFNWLVDSEVIDRSPFRKLRNLREDRTGHRPYENREIQALLNACPNERWRLILALAVTTGMRRGEILNLTVAEVDYLAGLIMVREKRDTAKTWHWTPKDREPRVVPITGALEAIMLRQQAQLPEGQPYLCLSADRYQRLIRVKNAGALHYEYRKCPEYNFVRSFRAICDRAAVPYRSFHALRGSCLSVMAENGLQPHELQAIAGHSDVRTTYRHYVKPRNQMLQRARKSAFQMGATGLEPVTPCL